MSTPLAVALGGLLFVCPPGEQYARPAESPHFVQMRERHEVATTLLAKRITVSFTEVSAERALAYLETVIGVPMLKRFGDTGNWYELDPETPITLSVTDTPALTVLQLVLEQCSDVESCTWQIRHGAIEVGTKARLSVPATLETRYYALGDLLYRAPDFDNAPELDLSTALGQTQAAGGGGGAGSGGGFGGGPGGGGPGGGSSGGSIITDPGAEPDRLATGARAQDLVTLITETIEPERWHVNGGDSRIFIRGDLLVIRAPDFIHRQLAGYPAPPPSMRGLTYLGRPVVGRWTIGTGPWPQEALADAGSP